MEPLPSEMEQREKLVEKIRQLVRKHLADTMDSPNPDNETSSTTTSSTTDPSPKQQQQPLPRIEVFGSQATGLFLPSSDIDCVVITTPKPTPPTADPPRDPRRRNDSQSHDEKQQQREQHKVEEELSYTLPKSKSPLQRFAQAIRDEWGNDEALTYLETIENTRIPLVKFRYEGIQVDVCFDQYTGPPAAKLMKEYLQEMPPLRPLTFVLKYFLAARELNEPYTGGVGSYMLQLMIVAFLQHRERYAFNVHSQTRTPYNLGTLLLEFLELYGEQLNYYTTGISVRHDGFFFPKGARDRKDVFFRPDKPAMLAIENPLDPTQDVGMSSFRYQTVQRAFAVAYKTLLALVTASPQYEPELIENIPSRLAEILPPTPYMTSRLVLKRRDRPLAAKRKQAPDDDEYHPDRNQRNSPTKRQKFDHR
jgi:non-canonical poly(A) RNA polymerase PAPD5/7